MKPVRQAAPMWGSADCLTACLASIFELELDDVPVRSMDGWLEEARAWVLTRWDLHLETFAASHPGERLSRQLWKPSGYSILITMVGGLGLGDLTHAVVALDGAVVHNPDPRLPSEDPIAAWWGLFLPSQASFAQFLARHEEARR